MTYDQLMRKTKTELVEMLMRESYTTTSNTGETLREIWDMNIDYSQEHFIILCLDSSNNILKKKILFKGGINSTTVDIKVLFNEVLTLKRCVRFLVAHNHPSGRMSPSKADIKVTKNIVQGAKLLSLSLIDHLIFSENDYYSFLEEGILAKLSIH